ncbi:MAG: SpoVG family protein [Lachnospiraceae bacterium]|nr:SpoVG family protein [Lachnospiraceae bacterium]
MKKMEVTIMNYVINVKKIEDDTNVLARATVVFNDCFKVTNIGIIQSVTGDMFVSMPSYRTSEKDENGKSIYKEFCYPTTKEFRQELYGNILKAYESEEQQLKVGESGKADPKFEVAITPYEKEGSRIKALGRVYLEDVFLINNVFLYEGKNDVFVSMPSHKTNKVDDNGKPVYADVCYPVTKEFREKLYDTIFKKYREVSRDKEETVNKDEKKDLEKEPKKEPKSKKRGK